MPSDKQIYLLPADEAALSDLLKEHFPGIRFFTWERAPRFTYFEGIDRANVAEVYMVIAPEDWEPKFEFYRTEIFREIIEGYKWINRPCPQMYIRRSSNPLKDRWRPTYIESGVFAIGGENPMSKEERSLADKIWRLLPKIGTYQMLQKIRGEWVPLRSKRFLAGNHAISWARQNEERTFDGDARPVPE